MGKRHCSLALAASALLAVPTVVSAHETITIFTKPVPVKQYQLYLVAGHGGLGISFHRSVGGSVQQHVYTIVLHKGQFTFAPDLSTATIDTTVHHFGRITLTFTAVGSQRPGVTPPGICGSSLPAIIEHGTLDGTFVVTIDNTYFKTVNISHFKAELIAPRHNKGASPCKPTKPPVSAGCQNGDTGVGLDLPGVNESMFASQTDHKGVIGAQETVFGYAKPATGVTATHIIEATGSASTLNVASDLSTATATGIAPFLSGSMTLTATAGVPPTTGTECGKTSSLQTGQSSGAFTINWDTPGTAMLAPGFGFAVRIG